MAVHERVMGDVFPIAWRLVTLRYVHGDAESDTPRAHRAL
jgi:hypothetical protein